VQVWRSADIVSWQLLCNTLAGAPLWLRYDSIIFPPAIVRSARSGLFALRLNRSPREPIVEAYRAATFVVATAEHPEGPFTFALDAATAAYSGTADFSLLQDGDKAFIAYGSRGNAAIRDGWRARVYPDYLLGTHRIALQSSTTRSR
jgi:hypothetical protein